jgi:hypothetical protein
MLARLATLPEGATMCPGKLARDCGSTLQALRAELLALAAAGRVVVSQRGRPVRPANLTGPFRVRLK